MSPSTNGMADARPKVDVHGIEQVSSIFLVAEKNSTCKLLIQNYAFYQYSNRPRKLLAEIASLLLIKSLACYPFVNRFHSQWVVDYQTRMTRDAPPSYRHVELSYVYKVFL